MTGNISNSTNAWRRVGAPWDQVRRSHDDGKHRCLSRHCPQQKSPASWRASFLSWFPLGVRVAGWGFPRNSGGVLLVRKLHFHHVLADHFRYMLSVQHQRVGDFIRIVIHIVRVLDVGDLQSVS